MAACPANTSSLFKNKSLNKPNFSLTNLKSKKLTMKLKSILSLFGFALLSLCALFARTSKPSGTITIIYFTVVNVCRSFSVSATGNSFTTGGTGLQATIKTWGGTSRLLWGRCIDGDPSLPAHLHHR